MGQVYRARDPGLGREMAIKVLPEEITDPDRLCRFEPEARATGGPHGVVGPAVADGDRMRNLVAPSDDGVAFDSCVRSAEDAIGTGDGEPFESATVRQGPRHCP